MSRVVLVSLLCVGMGAGVEAQERYDIVLRGGRVMDPESGLDAVRNVGIRGGRIAVITAQPLDGAQVVDVSGLVVSPGFVDLHAHGQDDFSSKLQARDGVTTALELEGGVAPVDEFYNRRGGSAVINFGATVSHGGVRAMVMSAGDSSRMHRAVYDAATDDEMKQMEDLVRQGLDAGAIGIGFGIQYVPGATHEEILRLFGVAAERGVTNFVHDRFFGVIEPGSSVEAVQELIADAAVTGASVHMVHVGSSGLSQVPLILDMIEGARERGLDVSTEVYPYTAASTSLESALFDPGWRARTGGDYHDIEWVATGERLDSISFMRYREQGGMIIAHIIPEEVVEYAIRHPLVMIASDGVPYVNGRAHPRGAGTFSRVLGRYVREMQTIPLMEALRKMTIMPARRLESAVPQMKERGRIAEGMIADITVFDPATVIDRATFAEPAVPSDGIELVMVNGTVVVRAGELVPGATPGVAIRRPVAALVP